LARSLASNSSIISESVFFERRSLAEPAVDRPDERELVVVDELVLFEFPPNGLLALRSLRFDSAVELFRSNEETISDADRLERRSLAEPAVDRPDELD
jgi:hypothetical protein